MIRAGAFAAAFVVVAVAITSVLIDRPGIKVFYFSRIDAAGAQFHHYFLGARLGRNDKKFYIDPDQDPAIISSLYPGYEQDDIWADKNLWRNYFLRDYDTKVVSGEWSEDSDYGIIVYQSFTGCFDIVRRYGADIIIMGASDLAQAVPPDELAAYFPGRKILMCAAPTFTLDTAVASLDYINQIYPKDRSRPEYVLVGVSRTMSYIASPFYTALDMTKQDLIHKYKQADFLGKYAYLNQTYRIPFTWNVLYPVRRDANHLPLVNRIAHPERWSILDLQITSEELAANPQAFDEKRRANRQKSSIFMGAENEQDCHGVKRLPELIGSVNKNALKLASRAVLFTTPTMGDELRDAPPCYLQLYKETFAALNGEKTLTIDESMEGYGLTITDFAFRDSKKSGGLLTFDVGHPNIFGAQKFTAHIAKAMKERFKQ